MRSFAIGRDAHRLRINKSLRPCRARPVSPPTQFAAKQNACARLTAIPRPLPCRCSSKDSATDEISHNVASAAHGAKGLVGVLDEATKAVGETRVVLPARCSKRRKRSTPLRPG